MLSDSTLASQENLIVDELIDFFTAASQTTSFATQTMFHHVVQNRDTLNKLR